MSTSKPIIELIPQRAAVQSGAPTEVNILVRVVPPQLPADIERPLLNLGLVLDRSGSMDGDKLAAARRAASFAVQQLQANDRVSVTIFDDNVETIVPSTLANNPAGVISKIESVDCGGMTALHGGWLEGGLQVSSHLEAERLNRVLLLTDGLANVGQTNPDRICSDVQGLSARGVSTSTIGLGVDYNEDLLEGMARSGDGNYYFIEGASQLPDIFNREMQGLKATFGRLVSLGLEPQAGADVTTVYNQLERNSYGRLQLSNLVAGNTLEVLVKLQVPARSKGSDVLWVRLAYTNAETGQRKVLREALSLPAVSAEEFDRLPEDARVIEAVSIFELANIRRQAIEDMAHGDITSARGHMGSARMLVACMAPSPMAREEAAQVEELDTLLEADQLGHAAKQAKYHNYRRHQSRS